MFVRRTIAGEDPVPFGPLKMGVPTGIIDAPPFFAEGDLRATLPG